MPSAQNPAVLTFCQPSRWSHRMTSRTFMSSKVTEAHSLHRAINAGHCREKGPADLSAGLDPKKMTDTFKGGCHL